MENIFKIFLRSFLLNMNTFYVFISWISKNFDHNKRKNIPEIPIRTMEIVFLFRIFLLSSS